MLAAACLLVILLISSFAACGNKEQNKQETGGKPEGVSSSESEEEPSGEVLSFEPVTDSDSQTSAPESPDGRTEENPAVENPAGETSTGEKEVVSVQEKLDSMTLEEKVAQMFVILPEALVDVDCAVAAGDMTRQAMAAIPVGGFIYMEQNLQSAQQVKTMLSNVQQYSEEIIGLPAFLCVDEEGGTVTRISGTGKFDVPDIGDMCDVGAAGDVQAAYSVGAAMGTYLSDLGFNVDFAPVADVLSNAENTVVKRRSFGTDPELVSQMAIACSDGLNENGVLSAFKHFPGHGATSGDTHQGYAYTEKTLEELSACELIPFQNCIDAGAGMIMVGHISLPNVIGDNTPASLSKTMITDILRGQMGYQGLVITDALNMGAVTEQYSSAGAAVQAVNAGVDIILMPVDFNSAYQGVLQAVASGEITEERIDESVARILEIKLQM